MSVPLGTTHLPGRGRRRWSVTRTDGPSPHGVPVGSHFEETPSQKWVQVVMRIMFLFSYVFASGFNDVDSRLSSFQALKEGKILLAQILKISLSIFNKYIH